MSTACVAYLVPLAGLLTALSILFDSLTQEQQWPHDITLAFLLYFWNLVVGPLFFLMALPFLFIYTLLATIFILPAVGSALALVVMAVSSCPFHRLLNIVISSSLLISHSVARVAALAARTDISTRPLKNISLLECHNAPISKDCKHPAISEQAEIPRPLSKKRRPINYSGSQRSTPLDRLDSTYARLMTHIARTRSPNCQLGSSKLSTAIVQRSILTPITDAKVVLAEENQETDDVISSGISVRSPVAPVNGLSAEPSVAPEVIHEAHDQKCEQNHISAPESLRPLTTFDVITDLGSINAECGPFPASPERSFVVSEALMDPEPDLTPAPSPPKPHLKSATQVETESDSDSVPTSMHTESYSTTELWLPPTNSPPDTCTPLVEVPASVTPIPVVEQDASLPYHIDESAGHNIDELSICQQKPEVFGHMVTATSIASVLDTGVYASPENSVKPCPLSQQLRLAISKQQPNDFTPDPIVEVTQSDTTFIEAVLPSAEMESHPTQTIQPFLYQLLPDHEPSDQPPSSLLNAERFQTPMEITTTPEPQAALTEAGQNSGETLTSAMCLPVDAQGQSQHGLVYDTSGANNPAFISTSNSVDEHSDTVYMDYQPSGPSDAELLELAAAVLATEAMDSDLNAWNPDTFGLGGNDNTTAQSQTDMDLLALDALLDLNGAPLSSPGPQLSNSTLENTHTSPGHSSVALFTEEELLALASSASAENTSETMLVDQTFTDFDLDLTHASISPLDSSQLELLDHATRLVMADLPSTTPGPSGIADSNNTATLDFVDASDLETCIDSDELARMWSDLGASLQGWAAHIPDAMDFSEESIARMMKELDALDSTPEPAHTPVNDTPEPALLTPVPMTQPRKIKNLPLRRAVARRA